MLVVGHGVVSQEERMWLTVPSKKKDDSGKVAER